MIRHVLLDADGVLQQLPGGWPTALARHLGDRAEEFLTAASAVEVACLRGDADFLPLLAAELEAYGVTVPAEELYTSVWHHIAVEAEGLALVGELRGRGLGVHLATNQAPRRAAYMRAELGYDELFDTSFYSCELGVAKPDPAFFAAVLDRLGAPAPEVLFVDDSPANVAGAREAGLAAEQWTIGDGHPRLRELLDRHGLSS